MNAASIERLGTAAAELGMQTAASVLTKRLSPDEAKRLDLKTFTDGLRRVIHDATLEGFNDARDAFDAGLEKVADVTFRASIVAAAAKYTNEYLDAREKA